MDAVFIISRTTKTTNIQCFGSSQVILRQEGIEPDHPAIRGHREILGRLCLVIYEVAQSTVDHGGSERSSRNTTDVDP
jgi:hypothetical protein